MTQAVLGLLALAASSGAPCFDTKIAFEANARLGLEMRWEGIEADPYNLGVKAAFFMSPDGERWAWWLIKGDEACRISKGVNGRRHASRPALR